MVNGPINSKLHIPKGNFKIWVDTERFSQQESALDYIAIQTRKARLNLIVIFYCWIEGWLCTVADFQEGGAGRDNHLFCGLVGPASV